MSKLQLMYAGRSPACAQPMRAPKLCKPPIHSATPVTLTLTLGLNVAHTAPALAHETSIVPSCWVIHGIQQCCATEDHQPTYPMVQLLPQKGDSVIQHVQLLEGIS